MKERWLERLFLLAELRSASLAVGRASPVAGFGIALDVLEGFLEQIALFFAALAAQGPEVAQRGKHGDAGQDQANQPIDEGAGDTQARLEQRFLRNDHGQRGD